MNIFLLWVLSALSGYGHYLVKGMGQLTQYGLLIVIGGLMVLASHLLKVEEIKK